MTTIKVFASQAMSVSLYKNLKNKSSKMLGQHLL